MPCVNDDPSPSCQYKQLTAILLVYVFNNLQKEIPKKLSEASEDRFCTFDYTPELCEEITRMTDHELELIVYAKNRTGRALADWWKDHQEADRVRIQRERGIRDALFTKRYGTPPNKYLQIEKEFYGFES